MKGVTSTILQHSVWLLSVSGLVWIVVHLQNQLDECRADRDYYRLYSAIEVGDLDVGVEKVMGRKPTMAQGDAWPATLGELPQYRYGCPASLLVKSSTKADKNTYEPSNSIIWLKWDFPDKRWIAVACLGNEYSRNSSAVMVVAKRRSQ